MEFEEIKITSPDGEERTEVRPLGDTEYFTKASQDRDHRIAQALVRGAGADEIRRITDEGLPERPSGKIVNFPKGDKDEAESVG